MKLLLIMPKFFDYPEVISRELKKLGYEVDCFDDRPSTSGIVKAIIRINKDIIKFYINNYFKIIMETVRKTEYDVVLLISGQSLSFSEAMIKELRETQPRAKFVLYQWDSLENFPYIKNVQKYFDKCYSFDRIDATENENLIFLPLFYSELYENIGKQKKQQYRYDFSFVGTAHPKKYKLINNMREELKKIYPKQFIYYFFPSRLVYFYRKIMNSELRGAHYREFHYTPMKGMEVQTLFKETRCVLDSAQAGQTGLTIRTIEALGAKKKLITTNKDIVNYDFYRPENVYVYEDGFDFSSVFFTEPYKDVDVEIYREYSLKRWLEKILG